ncbi:polysaccharide pyruvyl transferase family protein [Lysinibacillus sp. 1P01SD]|uniref:polysaccharide pyruvyl transferase family protein n=1 Tax=Lysinibacillus sp. 1P01SD TaxID=3132285 RepID=UPI00399FBB90
MKILHLASFSGNIGDVANHSGFYSQLSRLIGKEMKDLEITRLEIRKFYRSWGQMEFDKKFVEMANEHDILVIGGGNFFELCWDYSATGTTFDISEENLKSITKPIFINGIGIDDNKGLNKDNIEKFRKFLYILKEKKNVFFTVRNDGSYEIVKKYFSEFSSFIHVIPDHGFFVKDLIDTSSKVDSIGFNIALDMKETRYKNITYLQFLSIIGEQINRICKETNYNIIFFPHIISDYQAIMDVLPYIKNEYTRTRISIASLIQDEELKTFEYYTSCKTIFAMRFHANICALSLGVPVIPIISYPKHEKLYKEIAASNWILNINNDNFNTEISKQTELICNKQTAGHLLSEGNKNQILVKQKEIVYQLLEKWLKENGFKL